MKHQHKTIGSVLLVAVLQVSEDELNVLKKHFSKRYFLNSALIVMKVMSALKHLSGMGGGGEPVIMCNQSE